MLNITADEIRGKTFKVGMRGYDIGEVDDFLEYLARAIDEFSGELTDYNTELRKRNALSEETSRKLAEAGKEIEEGRLKLERTQRELDRAQQELDRLREQANAWRELAMRTGGGDADMDEDTSDEEAVTETEAVEQADNPSLENEEEETGTTEEAEVETGTDDGDEPQTMPGDEETEETENDIGTPVPSDDEAARRIAELERQLAEKESAEWAVAEALIAAQRTAKEIEEAAHEEAARIQEKATADAQAAIKQADDCRTDIERRTEALRQSYRETCENYSSALDSFVVEAQKLADTARGMAVASVPGAGDGGYIVSDPKADLQRDAAMSGDEFGFKVIEEEDHGKER